jgi:uncharacterized NAD-dependent epimerase/dehydratase family protein
MKEAAIILGDQLLRTPYGKTAHGLLRKSERFSIVGVVEADGVVGDAADLIGAAPFGIPLIESVERALSVARERPTWAIIGVATPGGKMSRVVEALALSAAKNGLSIINGLHDYLADHKDVLAAAKTHGAHIIDLRRPKKPSEMSYWTGNIYKLATPRIAVLGTDCIVGKRTTAGTIVSGLRARGIASEMIYTGQTGWLQGADYGFLLDATLNDFVAGEMEAALLACAKAKNPDVMVIEGQSSMQNPSTPCGAEILLSGAVHGAVLQHAPGRRAFCGFGKLDVGPSLETEIDILSAYNKSLLGICLNFSEANHLDRNQYVAELEKRYGVPVVDPLQEAIDPILNSIQALMENLGWLPRNVDESGLKPGT